MNVCFVISFCARANALQYFLRCPVDPAESVKLGPCRLSNHHRHYIGVDAFLPVLNVHRADDA
jgi:hypothetical protein